MFNVKCKGCKKVFDYDNTHTCPFCKNEYRVTFFDFIASLFFSEKKKEKKEDDILNPLSAEYVENWDE